MSVLPTDRLPPLERRLGFLILPLLLFALNFGLKYAHIATVQIGMDEPSTIFYAQMPSTMILEEYAFSNSPPLLELILHQWMKVFGNSPTAVRFPSMLFGCLTAVLLLWLGWKAHSLRAGLIGALLYTFSTGMTYFAHETRVYALFGMLTVASLLCLLWLRARPRSWLRTVAFALVNLLLAYSHYYAVFVIAWECLWVLVVVHPDRRKLLWRVGYAMGLLALVYLPSIGTLFLRVHKTTGDHWVPLSNVAGLFDTLVKYVNRPLTVVVVLALLAWAAGRWIVLRLQGKEKVVPEVLLLLGLFPGAYLVVWTLGLGLPMFLDRYLIFSVAGLFLVIGIAVAYVLRQPWQQWALAATVLVLMVATVDLAKNPKSEWREVADKIKHVHGPDDAVLLYPAYTHLSFMYHFDQTIFQDYLHYQARTEAAGIWAVMPSTSLPAMRIDRAPAIWVVSTGHLVADLHPSVDSLLAADYVPAAPIEGNHGITITGYLRKGD